LHYTAFRLQPWDKLWHGLFKEDLTQESIGANAV